MNSFMRYDRGTWATAYFERARRDDPDFRRITYDLRIAMYKTTYQKEFYWPEHIPKSNVHQLEPGFTLIPKPNQDEYKQFYTPKNIHRNLSDNKRIEPPLEYSNDAGQKSQDDESKDSGAYAKSLYQDSYNINQTPSRASKKDETPEEWVQKWKNECHNVRDADDLVHDFSNRIINTQKIFLNRKRIGDV